MTTVKHWTTRNDANHDNKHAEVNGIEFFAFPYQPYLARAGRWLAIVDGPDYGGWGARVYACKSDGTSELSDYAKFGQDKDAAFVWASEKVSAE